MARRARAAFDRRAGDRRGAGAAGAIDLALAQGTPFGVGRRRARRRRRPTGIVGWIMVKQAEFYKGLSGAIRAAKTDWSALWVLFGLSFGYGVFHAAGPATARR